MNEPTPLESLYRAQRDEVVAFYTELRQAYFDATGIEFVPRTEILNRIAPSEEDKAWLRGIGINI